MSLKEKAIKGTAISGTSTIYIAVLNFILVPILLNNLGLISYGLIGVVNLFSMIGYISLFGFGMASVIPKYIAEYRSKNKFDRINELVNTSLLLFAIIGLILFILLRLPLGLILDSFSGIAESYRKTLSDIITMVLFSYIFQFPLIILRGTLEGLLMFKLIHISIILVETFKAVSIYIMVRNGFTFEYVIYVNLIGAFILFIIFSYGVFFVFAEYKISQISFNSLKSISKYSSYMFAGRITSVIYNNADRLMISVFLSPSIMGLYEVLKKIPDLINRFLGIAVSTIIPITSSLQDDRKEEKIKILFHKGFRIYFSFIAPVIILFMIFSDEFLLIWLGPNYQYLSKLLILFLLNNLIITLFFGGNILYGINEQVKNMTLFRFGHAMIKLFTLILFIQEYELYAIVISYLLAQIFMLFVLILYYKVIKFNIKLFVSDIIQIVSMSLLTCVLFKLFISSILITNFFTLVLFILTSLLTSWLIIFSYKFDSEDKNILLTLINRAKGI